MCFGKKTPSERVYSVNSKKSGGNAFQGVTVSSYVSDFYVDQSSYVIRCASWASRLIPSLMIWIHCCVGEQCTYVSGWNPAGFIINIFIMVLMASIHIEMTLLFDLVLRTQLWHLTGHHAPSILCICGGDADQISGC